MDWLSLFPKDKQPTFADMEAYIQNPLWGDLNGYLQNAYQTTPKQSFSTCSGQPGWNVKYQKGGKALCTLYPMEGAFIALVVVGEKERTEVELLLPSFSPYTHALYDRSGALMGAKWLMAHVTDADVLRDIERIIAVRRPPKG